MNIKKLLYESFDRKLSDDELQKLDSALISNSSLQKEKENIRQLRDKISGNLKKEFSPDFEFEVMRRVNTPAVKGNSQVVFFNSMNSVFRKLAYAAIIFIILTVSYNFGKSGTISIQSALGMNRTSSTLADDFKNLFSFYD